MVPPLFYYLFRKRKPHSVLLPVLQKEDATYKKQKNPLVKLTKGRILRGSTFFYLLFTVVNLRKSSIIMTVAVTGLPGFPYFFSKNRLQDVFHLYFMIPLHQPETL